MSSGVIITALLQIQYTSQSTSAELPRQTTLKTRYSHIRKALIMNYEFLKRALGGHVLPIIHLYLKKETLRINCYFPFL